MLTTPIFLTCDGNILYVGKCHEAGAFIQPALGVGRIPGSGALPTIEAPVSLAI